MNTNVLVSCLALLLLGAMFAEADLIVIDGEFQDWESIRKYPDDGGDTFGGPEDATMDILEWAVCNDERFLYVMVTVKENIANGQTDRGAYQTILDTDHDYSTGIQSDTEAPYPPHEGPMGVDRYISVETKQGTYLGVGMQAYAPNAQDIGQELDVPGSVTEAAVVDNRYELKADLKSLGIDSVNVTIKITILHYSGAGTVDWTMPAIDYALGDFTLAVGSSGKLASLWAQLKRGE